MRLTLLVAALLSLAVWFAPKARGEDKPKPKDPAAVTAGVWAREAVGAKPKNPAPVTTAPEPKWDYAAAREAVLAGQTVYVCHQVPALAGEYAGPAVAEWKLPDGRVVLPGRYRCFPDDKLGPQMQADPRPAVSSYPVGLTSPAPTYAPQYQPGPVLGFVQGAYQTVTGGS